jgi:NAD(P)-dependent dehydrogenase (short-subunit alcohol dehydrogenase family)
MFRLDGKTALVTGAGSGIGEAIAHTLARAGALVYVTDRDVANGERVTAAIRDGNGQAEFKALDVTSEEDCSRVAAAVEASHGALDILCNNAGIGHVGTILTTTGEDMDRMYRVNVRGVFNVTKAFVGQMLGRRNGVIANVASVAGLVPIRDRLAYATTKAAIIEMTRCLAIDHATEGLRVNCVCPGRVETPFVQARLKEYPDPQAAYREMSSTQSLGRMGRPEEVAAAILYLVSDEASFVTGSALIIDGGWLTK